MKKTEIDDIINSGDFDKIDNLLNIYNTDKRYISYNLLLKYNIFLI